LTTAKTDVAHLLRRAGFGGTPAMVNKLAKKNWPDIVDTVLDTSVNPAVVPPPQLADPNASEYERWVAVVQFWFERMRKVPAPIQEKMALFWHCHFCCSQEKVFRMSHMWDQNQLFRTDGMGKFEPLVQKMAVQPAMLIYLDNWLNVVGVPQENFARELMELFTLDVGHYTQDDVVASARAWTGHGLSIDQSEYRFHRDQHDSDPKTFMGATKNWDGPAIIHRILSGPTRSVAAKFIASRLWSFFAYPNPEPALVDDLANAFMFADLDLTGLLRAIFLRPEFRSPAARGALVRSPVEFVAATLAYTGLSAKTAHPEWWVDPMGQAPFYPPNVSGWKDNAYWISSSAFWARASFIRFVTWRAMSSTSFLNGTGNKTVAQAVQSAFDATNIDAPSATTRSALEAFVAAERAASGWAERPNLTTLIFLSPEFQLA
jgi:uncharacterized protein (DUF1800 family)